MLKLQMFKTSNEALGIDYLVERLGASAVYPFSDNHAFVAVAFERQNWEHMISVASQSGVRPVVISTKMFKSLIKSGVFFEDLSLVDVHWSSAVDAEDANAIEESLSQVASDPSTLLRMIDNLYRVGIRVIGLDWYVTGDPSAPPRRVSLWESGYLHINDGIDAFRKIELPLTDIFMMEWGH